MSRAKSEDDRRQAIGALLRCTPEDAPMVLAERDLRDQEAFAELTPTTAAPMVACFRAVAEGYPKLSYEALMRIAWACFVWEREGKIPVDERLPFTWIGRGPEAPITPTDKEPR